MVVPNVQLAVLENCVPGEFGGTALLSTTVTLSTICCPAGIGGKPLNVSSPLAFVAAKGTGAPLPFQAALLFTWLSDTPVALRLSVTVTWSTSTFDPLGLTTAPVVALTSCGKVSVYVKGTPIETKGGPGGFSLSILSTGTKRFAHPKTCAPVIEPFTNQMKFPCDLSQERLPVKSTLSKMTSQPLPVPVKLMLEVSGSDAGKFRIVQFPSILICEGGTGLTKPSITPPKLATQPPTDCARAGTALSNNRPKANSRILIQLPRGLTLFVSLTVIYALIPFTETISSGTRQSAPGLDSGGPAVVGPPGPVRPVTLRRHLSVALPLSKSRRIQLIRFAASPNLLAFAPFRFGRRLHAAGRKAIGYTIVTAGTSFAPKLIVRTRLTTCVARSGASMSVDFSAHIDTLPSGSIVRRRTIWPFSAGLLRSSRLYNR